MLGFSPVKGELEAINKKEAEILAVEIFSQHNDIEDDGATKSELVKFYAPEIKRKA
jgi:hypothetical protein